MLTAIHTRSSRVLLNNSQRLLGRIGSSIDKCFTTATPSTSLQPRHSLLSLSTLFDVKKNNNNNSTLQKQQIRYRSNRSRRGLYDGKDVRFGNKLSFSMKHSRRKFKPNVFKKRVYSEILDEMLRFHITTSALRSIDKAGGLDNYLLTSKHVTDGEGLAAKKRIIKKIKYDKWRKKEQEKEEEEEKKKEVEKGENSKSKERVEASSKEEAATEEKVVEAIEEGTSKEESEAAPTEECESPTKEPKK